MKSLAILRVVLWLVAVVLVGLVIFEVLAGQYILAVIFGLGAMIAVTRGVPGINRRMKKTPEEIRLRDSAPKPEQQQPLNETGAESEQSKLVQEYTPYQVVHEPQRTVVMVSGERRQREGGFEQDNIQFNVVGDTVTGTVYTTVYKQEPSSIDPGYTFTSSVDSLSTKKPLNLEGARAELIEPQGVGQDYAELFSPVETFKTGVDRVVNRSVDFIPQVPKLRITLPSSVE